MTTGEKQEQQGGPAGGSNETLVSKQEATMKEQQKSKTTAKKQQGGPAEGSKETQKSEATAKKARQRGRSRSSRAAQPKPARKSDEMVISKLAITPKSNLNSMLQSNPVTGSGSDSIRR